MNNALLKQRSFDFAVRIVKVCQQLEDENKEPVITPRLLRAGTVVGAKIAAAIGLPSERATVRTLTLAYREARRTRYWLRILRDSGTFDTALASSLLNECEVLINLIIVRMTEGQASVLPPNDRESFKRGGQNN
jgi:four helix bundle protein